MTKPAGKKVDIEKIADLYLARFKGQPDALRLLMNMLADNLTNIDSLKEQIIKHEFNSSLSEAKADKAVIIRELSERYGISKTKIQDIVKED